MLCNAGCALQSPVGKGVEERRSVAGNALTKTTLTGASALAKKVRVIMSEPGTPEAAYGISGIKVHLIFKIFRIFSSVFEFLF